jgi:predicted ATPase
MTGWSLSNAGVPFFPFKTAFEQFLSANISVQTSDAQRQTYSSSEIFNLKAWLNLANLGTIAPQAWRDSTFTTIATAMASLSAEKPIVLVIDDLQWADSASISLLHYLSKTTRSNKILLIGVFRSEELIPDHEGRSHPLIETLRIMRREELFKESRLQGLKPKEAIALAECMIDGQLETGFAKRLLHDSGGNPLFIVESMRLLVERNQLAKEKDEWHLSNAYLDITIKIKDIVLRRAEMLRSNLRKMLDIASVIGEQFNPKLVAEVAQVDQLEVLESLNSISSSSSLVLAEANSYKFDHAKSRASIYEEIPSLLRREYHAKIAEKLEENSKGKLRVSDLAYHYSQSDNTGKAIEYSLAAGNEALSQCSGAEAIKHFEFVLKACGADKNTKQFETALEGLSDSSYLTGNIKQAAKILEDLSNSTASNLTKLRCLRKAMFIDHFQLANFAHTIELSRKATETVNTIKSISQSERLEIARVLMNKGLLERSRGMREEALKDFKDSIQVFEEEYSLPDLVDALPQYAWALADDGQLEYALATAIRASSLGEQSISLAQRDQALLILSLIFTFCGLRKEARQTNEEEKKISESISDPASQWWNRAMSLNVSGLLEEFDAADKISAYLSLEKIRDFSTGTKIKFLMSALFSGALSSFKGSIKTAINQSLKGAEAAEETDSNDALCLNYASLLREYSLLGDLQQAERYHNKLAKIFAETGIANYLMTKAIQSLSEGVFHSSKKQWKEANYFFEEALEINSKIGPPNFSVAGARLNYATILLQQNRIAEAKIHFREARRIIDDLERRFARHNVYVFLSLPSNVEVGQEFPARLDIVNIANKPFTLTGVESIFPQEFDATANQTNLKTMMGSINLGKKQIGSFQHETLSFRVRSTKTGTFNLIPRLLYLSNDEELQICVLKPGRITVQPSKPKASENRVPEGQTRIVIEFETESAQKTFYYLVDCFRLDYMRRRLPLEWSGWRTLMDIAKSAKVSQRSLYGEKNYRGRAITELEKRGLIEARVFPKERGRGGKIFKVRISYDRDLVKRFVDQKV